MANNYTTRLQKRLPGVGDENWDDEWHDNEHIDDVVMGVLLTANRLLSGGAVTLGTGLVPDYAAMKVLVVGEVYDIAGGSIAATAAVAGQELANWLYISSAGVVTISTTPPTGDYVPLALVDTSDLAVIRIADLRPLVADLASTTHAATAKTTPADADESGWWNSVTGTLVRVSWANLKATLKTYFDGLYGTITNLNLKANINSPTLTGVPAAPTAALGTNTTQLATTAFVQTDGAWVNATLVNNWVTDAEPMKYKKMANGIVLVTGSIKEAGGIVTGNSSVGTILTNLPAGYRPGTRIMPIVCDQYGTKITFVLISTSGVITLGNTIYGSIAFSFSFKAEN